MARQKRFADKGQCSSTRMQNGSDNEGNGVYNKKQRQKQRLPPSEDEDADVSTGNDFSDDDPNDFPYFMEEEFDVELKVRKDPLKYKGVVHVPKEEIDEDQVNDAERFNDAAGLEHDEGIVSMKMECSHLPSMGWTVWKVKCLVGRERNLVFCLMQKFVHLRSLQKKFPIISVFAVDDYIYRGHIFIEAERESHVVEACNGLVGIFCTGLKGLPGKELNHLLSVSTYLDEVVHGKWIRVKNGKYKGDLGQVMAVNKTQRVATVKLIPRMDLRSLTLKLGKGEGVAPRRGVAPPPRLIPTNELVELGQHVKERQDKVTGEIFHVLNGMMFKDGFLYKKFSLDSLTFLGLKPSDDELSKFSADNHHLDDAEWLKSRHEQGTEEFPSDESCMIQTECLSFSGVSHEFELSDLVLLGRSDYGLVISRELDNKYKILKDGSCETIVHGHQLKLVPPYKKFTALDHQRKVISVNDNIRVLEGSLKDRHGIVKKIYRGSLFIYDEHEEQHRGYFCCRADSCEKSSFMEEDAPISRQGNGKNKLCLYQKGNNNSTRFSVGQTLRIRVGPLKGHFCRVLAIHRSHITVNVVSRRKVFQVNPEHLVEIDNKSSALSAREGPRWAAATELPWGEVIQHDRCTENWNWNTDYSSKDQGWQLNESDSAWNAPTDTVPPASSWGAEGKHNKDHAWQLNESDNAWNAPTDAFPSASSWGAEGKTSKDQPSLVNESDSGWNAPTDAVPSASSWGAEGKQNEDQAWQLKENDSAWNAPTDAVPSSSWGAESKTSKDQPCQLDERDSGWNAPTDAVPSASSWGAEGKANKNQPWQLKKSDNGWKAPTDTGPSTSWGVESETKKNHSWLLNKMDNGWNAPKDIVPSTSSWGAEDTTNNDQPGQVNESDNGWNPPTDSVRSTSSWGVEGKTNENQSWQMNESDNRWNARRDTVPSASAWEGSANKDQPWQMNKSDNGWNAPTDTAPSSSCWGGEGNGSKDQSCQLRKSDNAWNAPTDTAPSASFWGAEGNGSKDQPCQLRKSDNAWNAPTDTVPSSSSWSGEGKTIKDQPRQLNKSDNGWNAAPDSVHSTPYWGKKGETFKDQPCLVNESDKGWSVPTDTVHSASTWAAVDDAERDQICKSSETDNAWNAQGDDANNDRDNAWNAWNPNAGECGGDHRATGTDARSGWSLPNPTRPPPKAHGAQPNWNTSGSRRRNKGGPDKAGGWC